MVAASLLDAVAIYSNLVAYQLDNSGFMGLLSYLTVLYAFASDFLLFGEKMYATELIAACMILAVTIGVSIYNMRYPEWNIWTFMW